MPQRTIGARTHYMAHPVQVVDQDFKSSSHDYLFLDRANAEFGVFLDIVAGVGLMVQLPDNEPVYFKVSRWLRQRRQDANQVDRHIDGHW
jgi:hypothetical protein